ncbi:MAG: nuclear transport factor 2 family protein [bacterium]
MTVSQMEDRMTEVAKEFGDAMERKDLDALLECFTDDCEIEIFDLKLRGKEGVRKWYKWTFAHMRALSFEKIVSVSDGDTFIEEYILNGTIHNGKKMQSRQARVLVFEGDKVKSFRLYLDRLQFADSVVSDPVGKMIVGKFINVSVKEMTQ